MIITIASQSSWTYLKDVVWIIKRFIEDSSKKVSFMVNSLSRHHKVHNKYWMFKEDYEDCSWRIMMEKPTSHATKRICFDVMRQNSHWVCVTCFRDLLLQLTSIRMMHSLMILKTYSKYHATKAYQEEKVLRMIFHEFSNKLMQKAYKFQSFSKLENDTFQWWVLSRLH